MKFATEEVGFLSVAVKRGRFFVALFVVVGGVVCCLGSLSQAFAAEEILTFSTPEKKQLYSKLTQEMRCLKCQNQNLAGSPAGLAEDLKREIFLMVEDNKSAAHITDFMVARYGDFILYKPAIKPLTLILWIAPFVLMFIGLFSILKLSKTRSVDSASAEPAVADDPLALERARQLLQSPALSDEANAAASTDPTSAR